MTTTPNPLAERRARLREDWNGLHADALFDALAAEPVVGDALCGVGDALRERMAPRALQMASLRVAAARNCVYTWRGHCFIVLDRANPVLLPEEIARVAAPRHGFTGADGALLSAVDGLLRRGHVAPPVRAALGGAGTVNAIAATQFYGAVTANLVGAPPEAPPIPGLETPELAARRAGLGR